MQRSGPARDCLLLVFHAGECITHTNYRAPVSRKPKEVLDDVVEMLLGLEAEHRKAERPFVDWDGVRLRVGTDWQIYIRPQSD